MAHLTIGQIIAQANNREAGVWSVSWSYREWECGRCGRRTSAVLGTADEVTCGHCGAAPPAPRTLGVVTAVDHERTAITVNDLPNLLAVVPEPRKWTRP